MRLPFLASFLLPLPAFAGGIEVSEPMVPHAPPKSMAHAAYMTLTNTGSETRSLIGVKADGYMMAHIHQSTEKDGIASMSSVDVLEIAPGQSVVFEHGSYHVMLIGPEAPRTEGDSVKLVLEFADGAELPVTATVMRMMHGGS